ncbi:uncharacterized protein LOC114288386 [Camellia sinensis]|uniref:uncharacterized protein LOC114288386 n=1 Tax=Camellia sinensis TaxID=4442 RepID=UPI001036B3B7|nr:uncharacterized protein LOC114288386 [Camellia sinensis]
MGDRVKSQPASVKPPLKTSVKEQMVKTVVSAIKKSNDKKKTISSPLVLNQVFSVCLSLSLFAYISNQSSLHNPTILPLLHIVQLHTHSKLVQFLGIRKILEWLEPSKIGSNSSGSRATCWFRFGKNNVDAESAGIYGSQSRDDFDRDDVEQVSRHMTRARVDGLLYCFVNQPLCLPGRFRSKFNAMAVFVFHASLRVCTI